MIQRGWFDPTTQSGRKTKTG